MADSDDVLSLTAAADRLPEIVTELSRAGLAADPVVLAGPDGEPAAVIIGAVQFAALADEFDALVTAQIVTERLKGADDAETATLHELAESIGIDLDAGTEADTDTARFRGDDGR